MAHSHESAPAVRNVTSGARDNSIDLMDLPVRVRLRLGRMLGACVMLRQAVSTGQLQHPQSDVAEIVKRACRQDAGGPAVSDVVEITGDIVATRPRPGPIRLAPSASAATPDGIRGPEAISPHDLTPMVFGDGFRRPRLSFTRASPGDRRAGR